jgi:hypothetical protein
VLEQRLNRALTNPCARPRIVEYLQQESRAPSAFEQSKKKLQELMTWIETAEKVLRVQQAQKAAAKAPAKVG